VAAPLEFHAKTVQKLVFGLPDPRLEDKSKAVVAAEGKEVAAPLESQTEKVVSLEAGGFEVVIPETQLPPPPKDAALCESSYHRLDDNTKEADKVPLAPKKVELKFVELDSELEELLDYGFGEEDVGEDAMA